MPKPFPPKFRERALRLVGERLQVDLDMRVSVVAREIAPRLGISFITLEWWWHQAHPDPVEKHVVGEDVLAENKRFSSVRMPSCVERMRL